MEKPAGLRPLFQAKGMFTIEEARDEPSPAPAQFRFALDYQDDRAEGHWPMPRRSDRDFKPRSGTKLALGRSNEWIPRRIGREVGQNGPNPRCGCPNVRGGFNQSHGVSTPLCLGFLYDFSTLLKVAWIRDMIARNRCLNRLIVLVLMTFGSALVGVPLLVLFP